MKKSYTVFKHPVRGYEVVKDGWSWPAFCFTWIWAFVKRLWLVGIIILFVTIALPINLSALSLPFILLFLVMGAIGNKLRIRRLRRHGYKEVGYVAANTPDGALAVHMESHKNE
jgi:hypothetical protein